ncbi:transcription antitermination protein NusG [Gottschalkia acidurici 9a]|uniref:Transcription termination/antitermination protein NusG n=1 Tax=Gottschalkia acidurici (strain ATCC 7906 / DSM 604 / BCRC 14475 / CIP 104303 / KCTC 5404 / NCIMB 10678 / 9a) TaxID=1128398 RepID=K0B197_GOTA9|nr:transcription termination/antitermination protein NusG [Gottschalkia acidurici]AFS79279.1 transcription antitermination protein NusG [Gottschalkia acidurici 9a]
MTINEKKWYVVHTYSGHENKVKANIEKLVENRGMQDVIFDVKVPTEEYNESKNGKTKVKERKMFPGYVLVNMMMTDESWYLVRNTRGVTGFVGPGSKPVPLSEDEVKALGVQEKLPEIDLNIDEVVKIKSGLFADFTGTVQHIDNEKRKLKVFVSMFSRETLVELDFEQVERFY